MKFTLDEKFTTHFTVIICAYYTVSAFYVNLVS